MPVTIPNVLKLPLLEPATISDAIIDDPLNVNNEERQAVKMIIIRRKKMKKHKLRKLRKRMKYENMKVSCLTLSLGWMYLIFFCFVLEKAKARAGKRESISCRADCAV